MIELNSSGYFISASDTDAGKTYIACEIVKQLVKREINVSTRKPAESGCLSDSDSNRIAADATALWQANQQSESLDDICPYRFKAALAPHRAAQLEAQTLTMEQLITACRSSDPQSCLITEGAGGFYSPIADKGLNADLAAALGLPIILVIDDRVGAVNQALMTVTAIEQYQLLVAAVIFNRTSDNHESGMQNAADFASYSSLPVFECGYRQALPSLFK